MTNTSSNWTTVQESRFPWEQEALEFIRQQFPPHEPYRAWSNFEFIANDGSINEVDLLVFTPQGFFLIEIKSRPGRLSGDAGTWIWETDGKRFPTDNPLFRANLKAKKLRSLLEGQQACRKNRKKGKIKIPYIETLVFCSAPQLQCDLKGNARAWVCLRDRNAQGEIPARLGIMAALKKRDCLGLTETPRGTHNRPMLKTISQAMEQAGIRPSQSHRQVSDYILADLIGQGTNYQDWAATHVQFQKMKRRVRIYVTRTEIVEEIRAMIQRAAQREFQLLERLEHPGILRIYGYTDHELGPALIFEHDPSFLRLDHYLVKHHGNLDVSIRIELLRQIAEAVEFAHQKKVVHRGLCPQSILVSHSHQDCPKIKIFNWQVAYQSSTNSSGISITSNVDDLVDDVSKAYLAPEALMDESLIGEHLDVFSLGAIAYKLFSEQDPATNSLELSRKLRQTKGLQVSSVINGVPESLQYLIQYSTHPDVANRIDSVADFLGDLDDVEAELTSPEGTFVQDPALAKQGDLLPGNFTVTKRLGQGGSSVALLVRKNGQGFVLKIANDSQHNERLANEAEVLKKLRHPHIVEYHKLVEINDRVGILLQPVFVDREKPQIETLGQRLRREGRLHIDLLQRFGEDLLEIVKYLEEKGINHRDIKPDNIAIGKLGRADRLHLVLFDFSLSLTSWDNIRAGTKGYLDPLLPLRNPPKWDLNAERYAAAITLYELATGTLPQWGDGTTDPAHLDCEITIDGELFDANLRDSLTAFFGKAFRRDFTQRFDNAEEMLRTWRRVFEEIELPGTLSDHGTQPELEDVLTDATRDTPIVDLGIGIRATNALDRMDILTVDDLLSTSSYQLNGLRGIGNQTRREIASVARILREKLGTPARDLNDLAETEKLGIDQLVVKITRTGSKEDKEVQQILQTLLGLEIKPTRKSGGKEKSVNQSWWSQSELAEFLELPLEQVVKCISKFQKRWSREPAITKLRVDLAEIIKGAEGVMSITELTEAILIARGSYADEPRRSQLAIAVLRAALEVESTLVQPRFGIHRNQQQVIVAQSPELARYAYLLGNVADQLAEADPLVSPTRVIQHLREVPSASETEIISDSRLVRLAASASQYAAVSSRQELYPCNMDAGRALKLSQGALYGVRSLTIQQIRDRVSSRYPEAEPLPDRPHLDQLLAQAGLDLTWQPAPGGTGSYVSGLEAMPEMTSGTSLSRFSTNSINRETVEISPEIADARQFEEKLQRGIQNGSFFALMVNPSYYHQAEQELCERFPVERVDFEGLFIDALRQVAEELNVNWDLVLKTDAKPYQGDWDKLMILVGRAISLVEAQLTTIDKTILLVYPGLLARYDQMPLLEHLREQIGRKGGIPGLWVLVPGERTAMIDGKPIPIFSSGQRCCLPESWLKNQHRALSTG